MTDLYQASRLGDAEAVRTVLAKDPYQVNKRQDAKLTALHAAAAGGHVEVTRLLLKFSASTEARDYGGSTPLHPAAARGYTEVVRALLDHDARPSPLNEAGDTPLHEAARAGHAEIVRLLLAHGADPNAKSQCGGTSLHAAAEAGQLEAAGLLLDGGALANARSTAHSKPWTPWDDARERGDEPLMQLLLRHGGADRAAGAIDVHRAASHGYDGRLQLLVDKDPSLVSSRDILHKRTPLHWAAAGGRASIAEMLLARGADPTATDKRGQTPAELARAAGHVKLAERLTSA